MGNIRGGGGRINTGILGVKGLRPERDRSGPYIQL